MYDIFVSKPLELISDLFNAITGNTGRRWYRERRQAVEKAVSDFRKNLHKQLDEFEKHEHKYDGYDEGP